MLLTIGDGLVAQIPALVISMAAGVIVSRVGKDDDSAAQITQPAVRHAARAGHHRRRSSACWA